MEDFRISEPDADGWTVIALHGELDLKSAPDLCLELTRRRGERVVVDLSQLRFCDSCGLRALIEETREARFAGGHVAVVAPEGASVRRLFELTAATQVLDVRDGWQAAA